jgi:23S rRNA (guanosine2251-2'-O)-methyltransferase
LRTDRPDRRGGRNDSARPQLLRPGEDLLFGRNSVLEALGGRRTPRLILIAAGVAEDDRIRDVLSVAERRRIAVDRVERRELDDLTRGSNHQGVGLIASAYQYAPLDEVLAGTGTVLMLDHLQDPQNLGTLFRAAEAAGVAGIVIPRDRAAGVTPAVVNASAGAVEHLSVTQQPNLVRAIELLKGSGRWAIGLDTGKQSQDLFDSDLPLPAALVIGSEGSGISPIVRKACDLFVSIPMVGTVASLNAATAGSIALFELVRRERSKVK